MKNIPSQAKKGEVASLAICCNCPDTGEEGDFLFVGPSHRVKGTRVTPLYKDLQNLFNSIKTDWKQEFSYSARTYIKL